MGTAKENKFTEEVNTFAEGTRVIEPNQIRS